MKGASSVIHDLSRINYLSRDPSKPRAQKEGHRPLFFSISRGILLRMNLRNDSTKLFLISLSPTNRGDACALEPGS